MELREVFEPLVNFLKNLHKKEKDPASKEKAKERLQLVLLQDRASVSPDFFEMMKKEIIEVIKRYIEIDEESLEVQLTRGFEDGDDSGPALYANIPIKNIKPVVKKIEEKDDDDFVTEVVSHEDIVSEAVSSGSDVAKAVSNEDAVAETVSHGDAVAKAVSHGNDVAETVQNKNVQTAKNIENGAPAEVSSEIANTTVAERKVANKNATVNNKTLNNKTNETMTEKNITEMAASAQIDLKEEQRIEKQVAERLEAIEKQNTSNEKDANIEAMKEKINEVKDGVAETIEKVKKGAKDGIKKIKTKTQKKKIKE